VIQYTTRQYSSTPRGSTAVHHDAAQQYKARQGAHKKLSESCRLSSSCSVSYSSRPLASGSTLKRLHKGERRLEGMRDRPSDRATEESSRGKRWSKAGQPQAVGGSRRKAAQSGGIFAHPDAPLAAPRRAELLKPNQAAIRAGNGGFAAAAGRSFAFLGPAGCSPSLCGPLELRLGPFPV
jgi:hypothetical protein